MGFQVTRAAGVMVRPAEPTPAENLELSAIDRLPGLRAKVRTLHVFEHGRDPGRVIREALGKALVCYYPFAGRLATSAAGEVQVACTGEGVWFVEAAVNCGLKEMSGDEMNSYAGDLLPDRAAGDDPDEVIMLMQVTQFNCGGFVLGLENSHCISDGLGTAQFLTALAELACGLPSPSITPIWLPTAIPSPPARPFRLPPPSPPPPTLNLRRAVIDLPLNRIATFKSRFLSSTGHPCSAFEAIAATLWQSRVRAVLKTAPQSPQFRLVFMANARPLIHPPLPPGFCSNCFFPVHVSAAGEWLASATTVEVVRLIREAKGRLPEEFRRWEAGEGEDPYLPAMGYGTLFLSEWSRLGFEKVDYGWGTPKQVVPLMYSDLIPVAIVGPMPAPATGMRLSTQCVEEEHERDFVEGIRRAWDLEGMQDGEAEK